MRLFLGFPIPHEFREYARSVQQYLRARGVNARWVAPERLHVTVQFIGEQDAAVVPALNATLATAVRDLRPARLHGAVPGTFGHPARVLFLGWHEDAGFAAVVAAVRAALDTAGVRVRAGARRQSPHAHVTLARFRGGREARTLRRAGTPCGRDEWGWAQDFPAATGLAPVDCTALILFESVLHPHGPEYRELQRLPLGPAGPVDG